jgi:hypothetical protein
LRERDKRVRGRALGDAEILDSPSFMASTRLRAHPLAAEPLLCL